MSGFFQLDEQRLHAFESKLADVMPVPNLEKGWDFYRREKVLNVQVMDGSAIYGAVRDTDIYAVTLDADDISFSTCTCSYKGYCQHMAAVYYAYCEFAGESAEGAHNRLLYGGELVSVDPSKTEHAQKPADATAVRPEEWLGQMERLHGDVWRQCRHSLHPLQAVLSSLKGLSKTWEEGLRRLHWMHAIVFVIELAEKAYSATDSYNRYYYEMAFARMTEPWVNHYHELAGELEPGA
ncbi:SWIM zinc finger domain-containing protein, partial [Paenibacillus sepulcri]|nr:SWIM zinc finger domain-containing protein [Paenibacillus sepulcri]